MDSFDGRWKIFEWIFRPLPLAASGSFNFQLILSDIFARFYRNSDSSTDILSAALDQFQMTDIDRDKAVDCCVDYWKIINTISLWLIDYEL